MLLFVGGLSMGCLMLVPAQADAADDPRRVVEDLRTESKHQEALEYLRRARNDASLPKSFKAVIDYEIALTRLDSLKLRERAADSEETLYQAGQSLVRFLTAQPGHELAGIANMKLGNVLVERAQITLSHAGRSSVAADEEAKLKADARGLLQRAGQKFLAADSRFVAEHKKFPMLIDENKQPGLYYRRNTVRRNLLQVRLAAVEVSYRIAMTYEPGSQQRRTLLRESAEKGALMYRKYPTYGAGLYARMLEGRAYKDLGETDKALSAFDDVLYDTGDDPRPFATLRRKALMLTLETYLLPGVDEHQKAFATAGGWLKWALPEDRSTEEGLAIQSMAATAALRLAEPLAAEDPQREEYRRKAGEWLTAVASHPGKCQQRARRGLQELGLPVPGKGTQGRGNKP